MKCYVCDPENPYEIGLLRPGQKINYYYNPNVRPCTDCKFIIFTDCIRKVKKEKSPEFWFEAFIYVI